MNRQSNFDRLNAVSTGAGSTAGELVALRQAGDQMQSALSRLAEYVQECWTCGDEPVPYEVRMAALEGQSAVAEWTESRRQSR